MITADTAGRSVTRPNVLAYPSATTARLLLLLVAILSGGAYIGTVTVGTIINLPFDTAALASVALPGITTSAVVSLICVPLVFLPWPFTAGKEAAGRQ
jgi:hypothetical protein